MNFTNTTQRPFRRRRTNQRGRFYRFPVESLEKRLVLTGLDMIEMPAVEPQLAPVSLEAPVTYVEASRVVAPDGDFNDDGVYDHLDIDALVYEIAVGMNRVAFDLTTDGLVDLADRDAWLAEAGRVNMGPKGVYLVGDANLDGAVDAMDFIVWNHHKFTETNAWSLGDFTADGCVDAMDFMAWNYNKFQSSFGVERPAPVDGDFNDDGIYDVQDIDALVVAIAAGTHVSAYDLTADGLVDLADRDAWLIEAGKENDMKDVYLLGDSNLDGAVDGLDFMMWNTYKFTASNAWSKGDFNADGCVDALDFLIWNDNKFQGSFGGRVAPVDGDFNDDGIYDYHDIDALVYEIAVGLHNPSYDLTSDGLVDLADRDAWLFEAGRINMGIKGGYLLADANLDGSVDALDFIVWNNHKFTAKNAWSKGDFNADGCVDAMDFVTWNTYKFQSSFPVDRPPPVDGDFNDDGLYDLLDIDALVSEIAEGNHLAAYDLTSDGLVDLADRDAWLVEAGKENLGRKRVYLVGDANLDGAVDALDFIVWNNYKFTDTNAWSAGDFNADGCVDAMDFMTWNHHKFEIGFGSTDPR